MASEPTTKSRLTKTLNRTQSRQDACRKELEMTETHRVEEVIREASLSIACCLDEVTDVTQQDLEHIQDQISQIEGWCDRYAKDQLPSVTEVEG